MNKPVLCLMGPTASGKTQLAIELALKFNFEIISVDSAMIYRQMNIGTAKPTLKEQRGVAHHLIDILDPPLSYSAAEFCQDVLQLLGEIYARGKFPLLVGGTMMYFQALQKGLSAAPSSDHVVRAHLQTKLEQQGLAELYQELQTVDERSASRLNPNDTQRILRALEVYYSTGQSLSYYHQNVPQPLIEGHNLLLFPEDRAWLHQRIEARFQNMLVQGFLDEVQTILKTWPDISTSMAMRSVGYRQALRYLQQEISLDDFIFQGIVATRQLAKRQMTWLRHWPNGKRFACDTPHFEKKIMEVVTQFMDNFA